MVFTADYLTSLADEARGNLSRFGTSLGTLGQAALLMRYHVDVSQPRAAARKASINGALRR